MTPEIASAILIVGGIVVLIGCLVTLSLID